MNIELRLQWLIRKLSSRHVKRLTYTGLKLQEIYVFDSSQIHVLSQGKKSFRKIGSGSGALNARRAMDTGDPNVSVSNFIIGQMLVYSRNGTFILGR